MRLKEYSKTLPHSASNRTLVANVQRIALCDSSLLSFAPEALSALEEKGVKVSASPIATPTSR